MQSKYSRRKKTKAKAARSKPIQNKNILKIK
jgi:hypothetical protein